MTRLGRSYAGHAELVFRAAPVAATAAALLAVLGAAASTAGIVLLGRVVGAGVTAIDAGPDSPAAREATTWVVWLGATFVAAPVIGGAVTVLAQRILSRSVAYVGALTAEFASTPTGIGHLEDVANAGRLHRLVQAIHEWTYLEGVAGTWTVIQTRLGGVGAFCIIAGWHWWAAVVLAAGHLVTGRALTAWLLSIFSDMALQPPLGRRRASYLFDVMMRSQAAKEIRLFGLPGWLIGRYGELWHHAMTDVWRRRNATIGPVFATTAVLLVCATVFYTSVGLEAWRGTIPAATVTALLGASIGLASLGMIGDEQVLFTQAMATTQRLGDARAELGLPRLARAAAPAPHANEPGTPRPAEVQVRDLRFAYPGRDTPIFAGLDLTIPAGQSIAVVGVNGAGKSTLIKLLCGLYAPDAGQILIDGADPGTDRRARERIAVIFQDFVRYHLSLRDNVALGARGARDREAVITAALHDAAADDVLARLDGDWDTVLSGEYGGGTDLSGGQWQRVALARALAAIAGGSGVLVLDEPTAALDVRAEAQLFDRFLDVTRGMTTLLVSHRLSSVRHADRIVVIDEGRIVENGSHEQLMNRGGAYARMFTLQASRFAAAGGAAGGAAVEGAQGDQAGTDVEATEDAAVEDGAAADEAVEDEAVADGIDQLDVIKDMSR